MSKTVKKVNRIKTERNTLSVFSTTTSFPRGAYDFQENRLLAKLTPEKNTRRMQSNSRTIGQGVPKMPDSYYIDSSKSVISANETTIIDLKAEALKMAKKSATKTKVKVLKKGVSGYKEVKEIKLKGKKINDIPLEKDAIVKVKNLKLAFRQDSTYELKNVIRGASLSIKKGEIFALIGESGSGKSVITSTFFGLQGKAAVIQGGQVIVDGKEVQDMTQKQWEKSGLRGSTVSAVFQNPMTTLNPTMKVGKQITEGIILNGITKSEKEAKKLAIDMLKKLRIQMPEKVFKMYPHQLSGGMKQRIVIAAIVSCKPDIIVMDEPTTALDPSVQADVLKIIYDLQKETGVTIVFITHDLGVVTSIADRIAIMYAGQIVELGSKKEIMWKPAHPYTWGLLQSMPDVNKGEKLSSIKGSVPNNLSKIKGDAFAPRNDYAMGIDFKQEPPYYQLSETHFVKSWLYDENAPKVKLPKVIWDRRFNMKEGE